MAPVTSFSYLVDSFQSHCCAVTAVKNTQNQTYSRLKRRFYNFDAANPSGIAIKDALGDNSVGVLCVWRSRLV